MQRVFSSPDPMMAGWARGLLEQAGIPCFVRNHYLSSAMGELPPHECWPEVWVSDDASSGRARELLRAALAGEGTPRDAWRCRCGESLEGQFSACWRCGAERPPGAAWPD